MGDGFKRGIGHSRLATTRGQQDAAFLLEKHNQSTAILELYIIGFVVTVNLFVVEILVKALHLLCMHVLGTRLRP